EELSKPYLSAGSTTGKREDLERGLEPDKCYYSANEPAMRGRKTIDLTRDPPPALGIEVDVASSSLNRMDIYAALKVPEVWRWRDGKLTVYVLQADGKYAIAPASPTFPTIPLAGLAEFVARAGQMDQLTLKLEFRQWVRQTITPA